jgi:uncharacterized OB-fold protein
VGVIVETTGKLAPKPGNGVIRVAAQQTPWIAGFRCTACGAVAGEQTMACRRCASRAPQQEFRASDRGRVHTWTVVERSYPGVAVPFISAVVDLGDGLTIKGTLRGVDTQAVRSGMEVTLCFDDAGGARDASGAPYVGFHFVPHRGDSQ